MSVTCTVIEADCSAGTGTLDGATIVGGLAFVSVGASLDELDGLSGVLRLLLLLAEFFELDDLSDSPAILLDDATTVGELAFVSAGKSLDELFDLSGVLELLLLLAEFVELDDLSDSSAILLVLAGV